MDPVSEVKLYGAYLGALKRSMELFVKELTEGFQIGLNPPERLTPELLEKRRQSFYVSSIQNERKIGRLFVIKETNRIRKELGLPPIR